MDEGMPIEGQESVSSDSDVDSTSDRLEFLPSRTTDNVTPKASAFAPEGTDRPAMEDSDPEDYDRLLLEDALSSSINDTEGNLRMSKDLPPVPGKQRFLHRVLMHYFCN